MEQSFAPINGRLLRSLLDGRAAPGGGGGGGGEEVVVVVSALCSASLWAVAVQAPTSCVMCLV